MTVRARTQPDKRRSLADAIELVRDGAERAQALSDSVAQRRKALASAQERLRDRARERVALLGGGQDPPGSLSPAAHHSGSAPN